MFFLINERHVPIWLWDKEARREGLDRKTWEKAEKLWWTEMREHTTGCSAAWILTPAGAQKNPLTLLILFPHQKTDSHLILVFPRWQATVRAHMTTVNKCYQPSVLRVDIVTPRKVHQELALGTGREEERVLQGRSGRWGCYSARLLYSAGSETRSSAKSKEIAGGVSGIGEIICTRWKHPGLRELIKKMRQKNKNKKTMAWFKFWDY